MPSEANLYAYEFAMITWELPADPLLDVLPGTAGSATLGRWGLIGYAILLLGSSYCKSSVSI